MTDGFGPIDLTPNVVLDEALIEAIQQRAFKERRRQYGRVFLWMLIGGAIGIAMAASHVSFFTVFGSILLTSFAVGCILSNRLETEFRKRHYLQVHKNLPAAMRWNALWAPFTALPLGKASSVYLRLLLAEERCLELEAISYYGWAYMEGKDSVKREVPKNFAFLNNIAVALIQQEQYSDALLYLEAAMNHSKATKSSRALLANNYTLCLIKTKRLADAEVQLQTVENLSGGNLGTPLGVRYKLLKGLLAAEKKDWTEVEALASEAMSYLEKADESAEFRAGLLDLLAAAQFHLNRFEEAELNIRSAIELFQSGPNPPYRRLAACHANYAELLMATGRHAVAAEQIARARECLESADRDAQEDLAAIRARLANPRRLISATDLAASSRRPLAKAQIGRKG